MYSYYSRSKKVFPYILLFVLGLVSGLFVDQKFFVTKQPLISPVAVNLTIKSAVNEIVDFQNLQLLPGSSVLELMKKLVNEGKINWELETRDGGQYISSMLDKKNQASAESWHCYINNQPCQTSLEKLKLQGQEHLEWRFEK